MYQWEEVYLPLPVSRATFVRIIFELGDEYDHSPNTNIYAVALGDQFVHYQGRRDSFVPSLIVDDHLLAPVPQCYSIELAYACVLLAVKFNEDYGYRSTKKALSDLCNYYLIKMERELLQIASFSLIHNPVTFCERIFGVTPSWEVCYRICLVPNFTQVNPFALILGLKMVFDRKGSIASISTLDSISQGQVEGDTSSVPPIVIEVASHDLLETKTLHD